MIAVRTRVEVRVEYSRVEPNVVALKIDAGSPTGHGTHHVLPACLLTQVNGGFSEERFLAVCAHCKP